MSHALADSERAALREVSGDCLCLKARGAARILTRFYDRYFAGSGVEAGQFNLLVAIRLMEPVSVVKLADQLALERTTLTRNIAVLKRKGIVQIRPASDGRKRLVSLAPKGQRTLKRAMSSWGRAQEAAAKALGVVDAKRFSEALSAIQNLSPHPGD